jgi:hypothetical protein
MHLFFYLELEIKDGLDLFFWMKLVFRKFDNEEN